MIGETQVLGEQRIFFQISVERCIINLLQSALGANHSMKVDKHLS
ncbi:hypothetical protein MICCA_680028 [Microcystis aeruginosa PCC 9432]|uniref:Uncharacterized protein n=3 Tax=Microcystis aeruginosa TaxID=1126 RepID=L7E238_MICAE|nr:hypothetical protein O53_5272 [Microcystis aeruginosa TAIHU98]CCH95149.1 hypothetical protein MICCA_680028 [Microcystis aeruginosa PCC 9432]CCI23438.1 hypothetical protein MICAG_2060005 [Microcystis aeruginosa PCC 9808]